MTNSNQGSVSDAHSEVPRPANRLGHPLRYGCWDVVDAPTPQLREERFLWRVYHDLINQPGVRSWGILSPSVAHLSHDERHARGERLENALKSMGKGFFRFFAQGHDESKCLNVRVFVVGNLSVKEASRLMRKYEQPVMLYSGLATGNRPALIYPDGTCTRLRRFRPAVVLKYLKVLCGGPVQVQNRPFSVLEGRCIQSVLACRKREGQAALDAITD